MREYTADFETTTDPNDCRVWAWGLCSIDNPEEFIYGNDIETFIKWCSSWHHNYKLWFHNLKFDSQFLTYYLMTHNYTYIEDKKDRADKTFTMLVGDNGAFYSMEIYFNVRGKRSNKITIYDSLKVLNFSVEEVAKAFDLPIRKLDLDYKTKRERWHKLTEHEIEYLRHDVEIMARAMGFMHQKGFTRMTIGSNALANFKTTLPDFKHFFPVLSTECDKDIRKSYRGGFTWLNPIWKGKVEGPGLVVDCNSMYPSVLRYEYLPVGCPERFEDKYQYDPVYPLYIQVITCVFKLKPGFIPTIQIKNSLSFMPTEYLESSNGDFVTLTLTSIDLELFLKHYNVSHVHWGGGYKFQARKGLFDKYIDYWTAEKIKAGKEGNRSLRTLSKLAMNSIYGRFAISPKASKKEPYLGEDGVVHYHNTEPEERDGVYIPVAAFCTSYSRRKIISTSMAIKKWSKEKYGKDLTVYHDTDSCHIITPNYEEDVEDLKKIIDIDDYKLGAWKPESTFVKGKWLHAKCYIEQDENGEIHTTVAGLPKKLSYLINFDNFKEGFSTADFTDEEVASTGRKLTYKYVKGGVVLVETDFTIK